MNEGMAARGLEAESMLKTLGVRRFLALAAMGWAAGVASGLVVHATPAYASCPPNGAPFLNPYGQQTNYTSNGQSIANRTVNNYETHYWVGHNDATRAQDGTAIHFDVVAEDPWVDPGSKPDGSINFSMSTGLMTNGPSYTQIGWVKYNGGTTFVFTEQGTPPQFLRNFIGFPGTGNTATLELQHNVAYPSWDAYFWNGSLVDTRTMKWSGTQPISYQFFGETTSLRDEMPGAAGGEQWHNIGIFTTAPWQWNSPSDRSVYAAGQSPMPTQPPVYFGASMSDPNDVSHMWSWDYACSY